MRLSGKRALVTGGSRGIGRAIALGFASEGADIAIAFREDQERARAVVDEIRTAYDRRALSVRVDVSSRDEVNGAVEAVLEELGGIDILVNNAGVVTHPHFLDVSDDEWNRTLDTNLRGPFLFGQIVGRHMASRKSGVIINVTSILDTVAAARHTPYLASKGGLLMLTRGMAVDLGEFGVRVNAIAPGVTDTDMNRVSLGDLEHRARVEARSPLRRVGTADDYVGAALFLASDDSSFMTGERLGVDGGFVMSRL